MLERAHKRIARAGLTHIRLLEADAAHLTFADDAFDRVYAPYTISVVSDPVRVVREMCRVCRRGGRVVILNHFRSMNRLLAEMEQAISPATVHIGFKADLDLQMLMEQTGLRPISVEKVNFPPIWSLVTCMKN
jgi:phosphatidylethanolamine/phosphatidyl-N-methylethanolamine N-methyltransferase